MKQKLSKKLLITTALSIVVFTAVGVFAKAKLSKGKADFTSQSYEVAKLVSGTGSYRITVQVDKNAVISAEVNDDKSYKEVKDSIKNGQVVQDELVDKSSNFSSSWVTSDGLRKSETEDSSNTYILSITGTTYSTKPLQADGVVVLTTSKATQSGYALAKYYIDDKVVYLDLSQTRKALLYSGDETLIKYGKAFPDFTSIMKFEGDDLILDNLYGTGQKTSLADFNYITFRKECLRALSSLLTNASADMKSLGVMHAQGDKYFLASSDDKRDEFSKALKGLVENADKLYDVYLNKLEKDKVVESDILNYKREHRTDVIDKNILFLNNAYHFSQSKNFETVNWVRLTSAGGTEFMLQASGGIDDSNYLITVSGESVPLDKDKDVFSAPTGGISYKEFKGSDDSPLVLTEFVQKMKEVKLKSLDEIDKTSQSVDDLNSVDITGNLNE